MVIAIIVAGYLLIGVLLALRALTVEPEPSGLAPASRGERIGLFLAIMLGWPLVVCLLIAILLFFWDLLLYDWPKDDKTGH